MFENIRGLAPERAARLAVLFEQGQPLLEHDSGMEAVQRMLRDHGAGVIDSVAVTRELLGAGPGSLGEAKAIVLSSAARTAELRVHQQFMEEIEHAKDVADAMLQLAPETTSTAPCPTTSVGDSMGVPLGTGGQNDETVAPAMDPL